MRTEAARFETDVVDSWWRAATGGSVAPPVRVVEGVGRGETVLAAYRTVRGEFPEVRLLVVTGGLRRAFRWRDHLVLSGFPRQRTTVTAEEVAGPSEDWAACVAVHTTDLTGTLEGGTPVLVVFDGVRDGASELKGRDDVFVLELDVEDATGTGEQQTAPRRRRRVTSPHLVGHLQELMEVVDEAAAVPNFRERHLGQDRELLVGTSRTYDGFEMRLVMLSLSRAIGEHDAVVAGASDGMGPLWNSVVFPDGAEQLPVAIASFFPAGTLSDADVVVQPAPSPTGGRTLFVYSRSEDAQAAGRALDEIEEAAWGRHNPYRGRYLRVTQPGFRGSLEIDAEPTPTDRRADLVLPGEIWEEIDANVHRLFDRRELLAELELGLNRGVLLAGAPGTGKTQLCRVVAGELDGPVTALVAEPKTMADFSSLYRAAERFAPALLVIEDIDVIVGRRGSRPSLTLTSFLVELDGAMTAHNGVVTLATTNNPHGIDEAARRAARFDRIVEFPLPSRKAREVILRRYLRGLADGLDLSRVARETEGASGADLRELVRLAVLRHGRDLTSDHLTELAASPESWRDGIGLYL